MKNKSFALYTTYTDDEYIAALKEFGFTEKNAKANVRERKRNGTLAGINDIVKSYREKGNKTK